MRNDPVKSALILATNFQSGKNVSIKADLSLIFVISDIQLLSTCRVTVSFTLSFSPEPAGRDCPLGAVQSLCLVIAQHEGRLNKCSLQAWQYNQCFIRFFKLKPKYEFSDFRLTPDCIIPYVRCYTSLTNTG